jgi:amidase
MAEELWRRDAVALTEAIRSREVSSREATESILERIAEVNPRLNALVEVLDEEALAAADEADAAVARGDELGVLHGVPATAKVNVDFAGHATTNGVVALRDLVAEHDSPPVRNLRRAGAVLVGRSNTPAFSLRWFTSNDLHGRTLNPFDAEITPGGSSGGAGAAIATGMGAIAHGNDYGGSIRYPAYCCGVVGLRPTTGRVPAYNATALEERGITAQLMSVQGPLARTVADARVALEALARRDPRDPLQVPAPLEYADDPHRTAALFASPPAYDADTEVVEALRQAAAWLVDAGWTVEEAEPPDFEEAEELWRQLVYDDLRRSVLPAIEETGDELVRVALRLSMEGREEWDRDAFLAGLSRRIAIARAWSLFLDRHEVLLLPVSWRKPFAVDEDAQDVDRTRALLAAQSPQLATALLGLPGLSVPTGHVDGIPTGVQLVATRYREDRCLAAGEVVERAAAFSALDALELANQERAPIR